MDVELLIHGVPDGHDYYGIKEEQANMSLFYDNSSEPVKFIVETKTMGNNAYAYYSYLRYKNIIGAGGRPGSYFGLTLRLDKYYQDAIHIYSLLEMLFKRYVVGTILTTSGDGYKYLVPTFASKAAEVDKAQQVFLQLFLTTCVSSKFLDIDASFIRPIAKASVGNLMDVNEGSILASMKKNSKVVLSPNYELNIEKEYKKKIQDAEGKGGSIVAQKDKLIAEKDGVIKSLNDEVSSHKNRLASLEDEMRKKDSDIQNIKRQGNLVQEVAKIKEPIREIADFFRVQDLQKHPQPTQFDRKSYRLGLLSCALLAVVLLLGVIGLFRTPSGAESKNNKKLKDLTEQVEQLEAENHGLKKQLESLKKGQGQDLVGQPAETPVIVPPVTLRIDVAHFNGGKLNVGSTYIVCAKNGQANYDGTGKWMLRNATIVRGSDSDVSITIKPTGGKVELSYIPTDANCTCTPRSFDTELATVTPTPQIIIEPNVAEVVVGTEYTFSVTGYVGGGTWGVDGFSAPTNKNLKTITVKAIDRGTDKATISFTPTGGRKVTNSYKYKKNS